MDNICNESDQSANSEGLSDNITNTSESEKLPSIVNPCMVCGKSQRAAAFIPCGHYLACVPCAHGMESCPMCREKIAALVRIYE